MSKIVNCWWYSTCKAGCIGIVKVIDDFGNEKFYIDTAQGLNEMIDASAIATRGAKFYPEMIK